LAQPSGVPKVLVEVMHSERRQTSAIGLLDSSQVTEAVMKDSAPFVVARCSEFMRITPTTDRIFRPEFTPDHFYPLTAASQRRVAQAQKYGCVPVRHSHKFQNQQPAVFIVHLVEDSVGGSELILDSDATRLALRIVKFLRGIHYDFSDSAC
jgi:hypothetical protein